MAGQFWAPSSEGGYLYSDELSDVFRMALQPLAKFRQFCDPNEADKPMHRGDVYHWNVGGDIATRGGRLDEREVIPETDFTIAQRSLTIVEFGNSVPYSGKLEMLEKQDIVSIIEKQMKNDAAKVFDVEAYNAFDDCLIRLTPAGGTSTTALTAVTNGTTVTTNNIELGKEHINLAGDYLRERNIPGYTSDGDYVAVSHPSTFRPLKDDLEAVHQYTEMGLGMIFAGEKGRYDGFRFVEQTNIPKGGAVDSTTFDPSTNTADAWDNAKSSWAFFFGDDTVLECVVVPEEMRAKIPSDFGRSKAIAWYALLGYGIVHNTAANTRIAKWDSAT